jgi:glycosyltransferase involved in cell wall biosynthesis
MSSSPAASEATAREKTGLDPSATSDSSVCFVTETDGFGGTEVHTLEMMGALLDRGYRIDLVECGHREYDEAVRRRGWGDRITIIHTELRVGRVGRLGAEGPSLRKWLRGWADLLADVGHDTLVFPKGVYSLGSIGFLLLCRRSFRKVFVLEHSEPEPLGPRVHRLHLGFIRGVGLWWYWWRWLQRTRSSCADRVIAVSECVRDRLVREYAHSPTQVVVVRNGVRWAEFARDDSLGAAFRTRHGIPDGFVFGMVTRLTSVKGVDVALRALANLVEGALPRRVHLVIAGDGPDREDLERLVATLGLSSYVTFTGFVKRPKEAMCACDAILFPSRREGLPLALLEAMAAGCIPIVTRISGMPEVVGSRTIGWVVQPEDPEALSEAMRSVLALDEFTVSRLRLNAMGRIQDEFDLGKCHRRMLEICGL